MIPFASPSYNSYIISSFTSLLICHLHSHVSSLPKIYLSLYQFYHTLPTYFLSFYSHHTYNHTTKHIILLLTTHTHTNHTTTQANSHTSSSPFSLYTSTTTTTLILLPPYHIASSPPSLPHTTSLSHPLTIWSPYIITIILELEDFRDNVCNLLFFITLFSLSC